MLGLPYTHKEYHFIRVLDSEAFFLHRTLRLCEGGLGRAYFFSRDFIKKELEKFYGM